MTRDPCWCWHPVIDHAVEYGGCRRCGCPSSRAITREVSLDDWLVDWLVVCERYLEAYEAGTEEEALLTIIKEQRVVLGKMPK